MTDLCEGVFTILTPGCLHLMFYFNLSWPIKLTGLTISTTREASAIKPWRNKWEGPAERWGGGQIYAWLIYFYRHACRQNSSNIVSGHGWDFKHVCLKVKSRLDLCFIACRPQLGSSSSQKLLVNLEACRRTQTDADMGQWITAPQGMLMIPLWPDHGINTNI